MKLGSPSLASTMALCNIFELKENIFSCILGIFELLGGVTYENVEVLSFQGIKTLIHMCFTILVLLCGICTVKKVAEHQATMEQAFLAIIFIWNFFILCVTDTRLGMVTSNYRYHLIGCVPLLCVTGITFVEWYEKNRNNYILQGMYLLTIVALMFTSYVGVFRFEYKNDSAQEICRYANENNIETVYIPGQQGVSEICRLLDYENATYLCVDPDSEKVVVYDYYQRYENQPIEFENAVLALYLGDYNIEETVNMFGHEYKPVEIVADFCIYQ